MVDDVVLYGMVWFCRSLWMSAGGRRWYGLWTADAETASVMFIRNTLK